MNKIGILLGLSILIIAGCMLYLVRSGVSLRSAPLIKPSIADANLENVARLSVLRLYKEFHEASYVVFGLPRDPEENAEESQAILQMMADEYEKTFGKQVHILQEADKAGAGVIEACPEPCWLVTSPEKAHQLITNEMIEKRILPTQRIYFSFSIIPFHRHEEVTELCHSEKRLTWDCLRPLSVREVERKMKEEGSRYFFMRKYNDIDHFLFLEESSKTATSN